MTEQELVMAVNPYAPPRSDVADVAHAEAIPALWNPNAAANWSLLFSPVFGAVLHMKNWQALGEPAKASAAKTWAVAVLAAFVALALLSAFLPEGKAMDGLSRAVAIGLLFAWYFSSARHQTAYVKERFGKSYPRRGWLKPLLLAVLGVLGFLLAMGVIGVMLGALFGGA
jgi:uncharacterized membrane protein YfcA